MLQSINRASSINNHTRKVNCVKEENYLTLNYKKMKKKRNTSDNFLLSLVYIFFWILSDNLVSSLDYSLQKCDAATQQNIFETLPQCVPRTSLVDLRQYFEDNHDIIQVNIMFDKIVFFACSHDLQFDNPLHPISHVKDLNTCFVSGHLMMLSLSRWVKLHRVKYPCPYRVVL